MDPEIIEILNTCHTSLDEVDSVLPASVQAIFDQINDLLNQFDPIPEE